MVSGCLCSLLELGSYMSERLKYFEMTLRVLLKRLELFGADKAKASQPATIYPAPDVS